MKKMGITSTVPIEVLMAAGYQPIDLPLLTLEGNADFFLNAHVKTRIEAFLDMIQRRRSIDKTRHSRPERESRAPQTSINTGLPLSRER